ncbi:hypothetical protein HYH02_012541 [Chlamydomonas schloesseri]|uniref:HMG box domain-containing protein n=1 Tax=Chlamydomonas schloesseri TaxID=2026947 RepID=A0A835SUK5_9CHLO|nr:hypothetical protein HYH02_012541 [Chlamydomonas schloesseri]|eukprot:KAG2433612.1 hypothetical protein HYH02_012541 [Chlamydomonas schloesseri]
MSKRGHERNDVIEIPKLPLPAFIHFINANRDAVLAANPGLPVNEVAKRLGRRWSNLDPEDKQQYSNLALRDRLRFNKEVVALEQEHGPAFRRQLEELEGKEGVPKWLDQLSFGCIIYYGTSTKWRYSSDHIKDPDAPKPPKPAYTYFSTATYSKIRARNPGMLAKEIPPIIRERWQALDAAGRRPYEQQADHDRERYWVEMEAYSRALQQQGGGGGGVSGGGGGVTAAAVAAVNACGSNGTAQRSTAGPGTVCAAAPAVVPMKAERLAGVKQEGVGPAGMKEAAGIKVEVKEEAVGIKVEVKEEQAEQAAVGVKVEVKEEEQMAVVGGGVKVEVKEEEPSTAAPPA